MLAILIVVFLGLVALNDYYRRNYYWKRRGVVALKSVPFFGNVKNVALGRVGIGAVYNGTYGLFPNLRYYGVFEYHRPVLVIRDPEMAQTVLVKEFAAFADHPHWIFDDISFLRYGTLNLTGNLWRAMRFRLSKAFSSVKLQSVFHRLHSLNIDPGSGTVDTQKLFDHIAAQSITAFLGTQIVDLDQTVQSLRSIFKVTPLRHIQLILVEHFPRIASFIGATFASGQVNAVYRDIVKTMTGTGYQSEFKTLMESWAEEKEMVLRGKDFDVTGVKNDIKFEITQELLQAQAAQFFFAGLDTTANTMAYMAYELSRCPEAQLRIRNEAIEAMRKHGGQLTYEGLLEMKYTQYCVNETARLHPPLPFIFRVATRDFQFENGPSLQKGDKLVIPGLAMQKDPQYFPDPTAFKPERWESIPELRNGYTYMPFGDGPRQCLGMRLSFMMMKLHFSRILLKYEMSLSPKTLLPVVEEATSFIGARMARPLYIDYTPL